MNSFATHPSSLSRLFSAIQSNLEQRAYSPQTIKAYLGQFRNFVRNRKLTSPRDVTDVDIRQYLADLITQGKSRSTVDQDCKVLSYFHKTVYNQDLILEGFKRSGKKK
jgi:site-specific recombinase XerD